MASTIRIGCSSAFWGDTSTAAAQLVLRSDPPLNYLVADYLAEVTMVILARSKQQAAGKGGAGEGGFVQEFASLVYRPLALQLRKNGTRIVTNAGGLNPLGLKRAIEAAAKEAGVHPPPRVAAVIGDDLSGSSDTPAEGARDVHQLREASRLHPFGFLGEDEPLWPEDATVLSCNAYLGARPIAQALAAGAEIVVTGRCVDSAIVLGPLMHEFGWRPNQYDLLSAGSLVGHILECGAQATGGNFTDWEASAAGGTGWHDMGFPIAECSADGSFVVTKPRGTGGIVTRGTVGEQLVYEIADPGSYVLPDVVCDWRDVTLIALEGADRVLVSGARGRAPTPFYKVCATRMDAFLMSAQLLIPGIDAEKKALAVGAAILKRVAMMLEERRMPPLIESRVEVLGAEAIFGPHSRAHNTREVVLRVAAKHSNPKALALFGREVAPAATGMAPGITGAMGGRPTPTPAIRLHSCLVSKNDIPVTILGPGENQTHTQLFNEPSDSKSLTAVGAPRTPLPAPMSVPAAASVEVPLLALCWARSGDKGDMCNIGVIAREARFYPLMLSLLTDATVKAYMAHLVQGTVKRFELPGISALNFVCTRALGGGGVASLNIDRQGKTFGQQLLTMPVKVPGDWLVGTVWAGSGSANRARM